MANTDNNKSDFLLTDENGKDIHVNLLGFADYEEKVYVLCAPYKSEEEEDAGAKKKRKPLRVIVLRLTYEEGEPKFSLVEDEDLCARVLDVYYDRLLDEGLGG
ncbi:MAG: DUF1292 domain-containing protein [Clostridia bacterium]|jgi:hypothetical protein|nr:DUF1292 domain-containing protein [Clostridia bacterium]MBO7398348.1 DUF1292 domain-containing protein [Clostridia bacterium]MBO7503654.1 DUF1292 domain-containing protein [Clostridia bacterium]MBO7659083.1 DUF1292 domain-containing protein [Clostridia bacterium]MBP5665772.1 DUF1292 domain-containing protein [Clostridia bacterium]